MLAFPSCTGSFKPKGILYCQMGGCKEGVDSCTNKTCKTHEVDIMHFSIGNAIPGRLYGGNPIDNRDGNGGDRCSRAISFIEFYTNGPHIWQMDSDLIFIISFLSYLLTFFLAGSVIWLIFMPGTRTVDTQMELALQVFRRLVYSTGIFL